VGAVGFCEQAPRTEAAVTSMTRRIVRDIDSSVLLERHRYDRRRRRTDIAGGDLIHGGAFR